MYVPTPPLQGSPAPPSPHLTTGRPCSLRDRRPLARSGCAPALWPPGPGPWQPGLSELSFYLLVGSWRAPLSHLAPLPTVKADKKAAQEKMIQQEHERQVWGAVRAWGPHRAQPSPTFTAVSAAGAGRRASCHGPQDPHEVRLTQPASGLSWVPHHQPTQSSDQALRVEEY